MRPIDADAAKHKMMICINAMIEGDENKEFAAFAKEMIGYLSFAIDDIPTIEAEPVRHARWVKDKDGFHHCSECGENTDRQEDAFGYDISEFKTIYCGNCGAKMDKK